jgi:pimeloyl-ACP methyl ester carboxylesterase
MRSQSVSYAFIVGLIAWGSGVFAQDTRPADALPKLPAPSGPFGIGRVGYDWVDPSRPDGYSSDPNAHRELMVYFWYPTTGKSADAKGSYFPGAQRMDTLSEVRARLAREFSKNWSAMVSGTIFSHAVDRAPVAKSPRRLPVVIFSHGLGSTGFNYTCLIEDLVSRGYIVVSIEHTYINLAVWFPDGRVAPRHNDPPPTGLSPEERFKWTVARTTETITEGAADVRFALDRISAANANPQDFLLAGRLDLNRVAAMGHSAGAEFAARACQLDARFKACIDLDGGMVPIAALPDYPDGATLKQPLLLLEPYYTESQMAGTSTEHAAYFKKKEEQLQATRPGTYDVVLRATGLLHPAFSDIPLLFAGQDGYPPTDIVLHNLELIEKYVREFLGKNLWQEKAPLLDSGSAAIPEATVKRYGH